MKNIRFYALLLSSAFSQLSGAPSWWKGSLAVVAWLLAAAIQVCAATFNVRDYGAVGDGKFTGSYRWYV